MRLKLLGVKVASYLSDSPVVTWAIFIAFSLLHVYANYRSDTIRLYALSVRWVCSLLSDLILTAATFLFRSQRLFISSVGLKWRGLFAAVPPDLPVSSALFFLVDLVMSASRGSCFS